MKHIDITEEQLANLQKLSDEEGSRLSRLMELNNEGSLSAAEKEEFVVLGDKANRLSMENAQYLSSILPKNDAQDKR